MSMPGPGRLGCAAAHGAGLCGVAVSPAAGADSCVAIAAALSGSGRHWPAAESIVRRPRASDSTEGRTRTEYPARVSVTGLALRRIITAP